MNAVRTLGLAATIAAVWLAAGCHLAGPAGPAGGPGAGTAPNATPHAARKPVTGRYDPRSDEVSGLPAERPLAVMIGNSAAARPQSGLDRASIVYEALTEGGITRFLAIYRTDDVPVIGPIRSARPHFIDLMRPFGAVFVHCGQSPAAAAALAREPAAEINELGAGRPFWRDHHRRAPHNLYASTASLLREAQHSGLGSGGYWPLPADEMPPTGSPARSVLVEYRRGETYVVRYDYDESSGQYRRSVNGKPHRDARSGNPLTAGTVIVEEASTADLGVETGELAIGVTGSGRCWFIRDGRWTAARWFRETRPGRTRYEDQAGNMLGTAPGPVWVQIIPAGTKPVIRG